MPPTLSRLVAKGIAKEVPSGFDQLVQWEVYVGSAAYACDSDTSDLDVTGWYMLPKNQQFPHLDGIIVGFDQTPFLRLFKGDGSYVEHHMFDKDAQGGVGREYDYNMHCAPKFFNLLCDNNPTLLESLFVPDRCRLHSTQIGQMVRDKRHMFLSREVFHTCGSYARGQLHKLRTKDPTPDSKRYKGVREHGFDRKFATHIVRLIDQAYQMLTECDLDIEKNAEKLKSIRRGDWTLEDVENYFKRMEPLLEKAHIESKLPAHPNRDAVRSLLADCLEQHYGSLSAALVRSDAAVDALREIEESMRKYEVRTRC